MRAAGGTGRSWWSQHRRRSITLLVIVVFVAAVVVLVAGPTSRDRSRFTSGHAAYLDGRCVEAVQVFDDLISSSRLFEFGGYVGRARRERSECLDLLEIDRTAAAKPGDALVDYLSFATGHPASPLVEHLPEHVVEQLGDAAVTELASIPTCRSVPELRTADLVEDAVLPALRMACLDVLRDGGEPTAANAMAITILDEHPDSPEADAAVTFLVDTVDGCTALLRRDLAGRGPAARAACLDRYLASGETTAAYEVALGILAAAGQPGAAVAATTVAATAPCTAVLDSLTAPGLAADPAAARTLLERCIAERSGTGGDAADLQLEFVIRFPADPSTPAYRAAFTASPSACGLADRVRTAPSLAALDSFLPDYHFACGQVADYVGNAAEAVAFYEEFLAIAGDDPRVPTARDGLARSLIRQAQAAGAGELPPPTPVGGSGSSSSVAVIYNQSPHDLRVVMSGPESRIETIPACGDCTEYRLVGPLSCRSDVPQITVTVPAGTYQVMAEATDGSVSPFVGSWTLDRGDRYESCFYIVTTFA